MSNWREREREKYSLIFTFIGCGLMNLYLVKNEIYNQHSTIDTHTQKKTSIENECVKLIYFFFVLFLIHNSCT